jgi:hypothetical protein
MLKSGFRTARPGQKSCKIRPIVALLRGAYFFIDAILEVIFWPRQGGGEPADPRGRDGGSRVEDPPGDGGPDEAASFIAETVTELALLARRHKLGMLILLLEMAQMEAEERVRLRGKGKLS